MVSEPQLPENTVLSALLVFVLLRSIVKNIVLETQLPENTVLSALLVFVRLQSIVKNMVWETHVAENTVLSALSVSASCRSIVKNNVLRHMVGTQDFLLSLLCKDSALSIFDCFERYRFCIVIYNVSRRYTRRSIENNNELFSFVSKTLIFTMDSLPRRSENP